MGSSYSCYSFNGLLAYNIFMADGEMFGGYSNQFILLIGGVVAAIVGFFNKVTFKSMLAEIWENLKSSLYTHL